MKVYFERIDGVHPIEDIGEYDVDCIRVASKNGDFIGISEHNGIINAFSRSCGVICVSPDDERSVNLFCTR